MTGTTNHKPKTIYTNKRNVKSRNITTAEYKDVVTECLLPKGTRQFGEMGIDGWFSNRTMALPIGKVP